MKKISHGGTEYTEERGIRKIPTQRRKGAEKRNEGLGMRNVEL
jgi:hypothetical protein